MEFGNLLALSILSAFPGRKFKEMVIPIFKSGDNYRDHWKLFNN